MSYIPPQPDQVNAANSSTTPLSGGATFTGTAVDCTTQFISSVSVFAFADQASATDGFQLQWSQNGTNWDHVQDVTVAASISSIIADKVRARYFRVVYTNGSVAQGLFRLQTLVSTTNQSGTVRDLETNVEVDDEAQLVRSVNVGMAFPGNKFTQVITDIYGSQQVVPGGQAADAFGRMRVSNPVSLFDAQFQYDTDPLLFQTSVTGTGTVTKTANESSITLSTGGTGSGAQAINQTRTYFRYEPGKSQQILMTAVLGAQKANVNSRIGFFDANDGVFFQMDGSTGAAVVQRSSTSGSPVNTVVPQANWNVDKMDGTGPSGITIDFSKTQIFAIDLQWLGVGRVRFGFDVLGVLVICHQINNSNSITSPYMNTANLPLRAEITNTGVAASTTSMKQICMTAASEGGKDNPSSYQFTANNGTAGHSTSTRSPILSIAPKLTFNGIANRGQMLINSLDLLGGNQGVLWELVFNGALTGASFSSVDPNSIANVDTSASAISGGTIVDSGWIPNGGGAARSQIAAALTQKFALGLNLAGNTADTLTLVATSFGAATVVNVAMTWYEDR